MGSFSDSHFAGYDGAVSLNSVEFYNAKRNDWLLTTPMSSHRSACGVVALGQYLYCLGGHNGLEIFHSVGFYFLQCSLFINQQK